MKSDPLQGIIFKTAETKNPSNLDIKLPLNRGELFSDIKRRYNTHKKMQALKKYRPTYIVDLLEYEKTRR